MKSIHKNFGFKKPVIDKKHFILGQGNVPLQVLQKDGDWSTSLPTEEQQFIPGFDTYNCTGFGSTNQIEMYMLKRFGEKVNYSDRWVGIIAGTDPKTGGNDPHTVYEAIRKYGLIPEEMLPFSNDIGSAEDYFSFKGADEAACRKAGQDWLLKYDFKHEWVFDPEAFLTVEERYHNMKVALKYSPLALAVFAWQTDERNVYVAVGDENHWTSLYAFTDFEKVFDSYDPFKKDVEQKPLYVKRISIEAKAVSAGGESIINLFINFIRDLWHKIIRSTLSSTVPMSAIVLSTTNSKA